jgi:hypothetical protein
MSRLMARSGGNVALYERIARKHEAAYRRHLGPLYARRAMVAADLARHVLELRLEEERWLGPELRKKREHAAALRDKVPRERKASHAAQRERETIRLGARVAGLVLEKVALAAELAASEEERRADDERMRTSLSWRVTAPLRAVHGWIFGRGTR